MVMLSEKEYLTLIRIKEKAVKAISEGNYFMSDRDYDELKDAIREYDKEKKND